MHGLSFVLHVFVVRRLLFVCLSTCLWMLFGETSLRKRSNRIRFHLSAMVNRSGHDCPYSLRMVACLLLYEITSFLRETYDSLPKLSTMPTMGPGYRQQQRNNNAMGSAPPTVVETSSTLTDKRSTDRMRMGSVASQTSNRSSASLSSEHPARQYRSLRMKERRSFFRFSFASSVEHDASAHSQYDSRDHHQHESDFARRTTHQFCREQRKRFH